MPAANPTELENLTRLLLEDVCCDLVRLLHAGGDPARLGAVRIDREWALGPDGSFADLRVEPDEIVISNVLRYALRDTAYEFAAMGPTEVRHLGTLQPWKLVQKTSVPPQTKTPRSRQTKAYRQQESEQ